MEIKFPEQENPFRKTLLQAIFACLLALCIGLFLGNALGAIFGTDDSVISTSTYTDNMAAVKALFMDADQLDSYMDTASTFYEMDGLRLYANAGKTAMVCHYQGKSQSSDEMFGESIRLSLRELMNTEEALLGQETTAGDPIEGIALTNIAVEDGIVFYYLYYDEYGYIGIAYDHNETMPANMGEYAMPLVKNSEGDTGMWYIIYYLED